MSQRKRILSGEDKVLRLLSKALRQNLLTPILESGTVTAMGLQFTALNNAVIQRQSAIAADGILVKKAVNAGKDLRAGCSAYFVEVNENVKIRVGGNNKSVRAIFGLNIKTGKQSKMDTEKSLLLAADKIKDGDLKMISGGYVVNIAFTASTVLGLSDIYQGLLNNKSTAQSLITDKEVAVQKAYPAAKITADDVGVQVKHFYRHMTDSQIRNKMRLFGCTFETRKETTDIEVIVKLPDDKIGVGASGRIGLVQTKRNKKAKGGVKGTADVDGMMFLKTTATGNAFLIVKMLGFEDNITPITIEAGKPQRIVVMMIVGDSSL